jgi:hypothetical protein
VEPIQGWLIAYFIADDAFGVAGISPVIFPQNTSSLLAGVVSRILMSELI